MRDCVLHVTQRKRSALAHARWTAASFRCASAHPLPAARHTCGPDVMTALWSTSLTPARHTKVPACLSFTLSPPSSILSCDLDRLATQDFTCAASPLLYRRKRKKEISELWRFLYLWLWIRLSTMKVEEGINNETTRKQTCKQTCGLQSTAHLADTKIKLCSESFKRSLNL